MGLPPDVGLSGLGSEISLAREILQSWRNVTFRSIASSIKYHVAKHGKGVSIAQYTRDAVDFFKKNSGLGKDILLKDGSTGIKITTPGGGPGGIFTTDGKIVTFWYK
jgi:hypothetical protein